MRRGVEASLGAGRAGSVPNVGEHFLAPEGCRRRRSLSGYEPRTTQLLLAESSSPMPHVPPLVSTLAIGLVLAFALGVLAHRFKLPPLVGYLLAGILIGPFTPGYVADQNIANQLAEVGVILLMFGVGLHFSLEDLLSVRAIAVPGALAQALVATPLGIAVGWWLGWTLGGGLVFGVALSVASTVVLLRLLQERRLVETERGRITVGWLIVQDLAMVIVLVLLPALAGLFRGVEAAPDLAEVLLSVAIVLGKFAVFVAVMLLGRQEADPGASCITSPIPAAASCSVSPCSPSRSAWPTSRRRCSASRSRSAPSSPA